MKSHQLINQDSGNTEYYTDPKIIAKAKLVMGGIDLDPASSQAANATVEAANYFTKEDNGLLQLWSGRLFVNHPFSKGEKACPVNVSKCKKKVCRDRGYHIHADVPGNSDWINKLVDSYHSGDVTEALAICYSSTSEAWFQPLTKFPQCYLAPRTNYYDAKGNKISGVTKGSVITYLGDNVAGFYEHFCDMGTIKVPYVPVASEVSEVAGSGAVSEEEMWAEVGV